MQLLENANLVGKSAEEMLTHIFACHDEIRRLKASLAEIAAMAASNTEHNPISGANRLPRGYFDIFHAATMAENPNHFTT